MSATGHIVFCNIDFQILQSKGPRVQVPGEIKVLHNTTNILQYQLIGDKTRNAIPQRHLHIYEASPIASAIHSSRMHTEWDKGKLN